MSIALLFFNIEDKDKEYIYESILRRMYTINDIPSCKVLDFIKQKYRFEKIELKMWQKCWLIDVTTYWRNINV